MHRAFSVPRWIGGLSFMLALVLHFGTQPVSAQSLNLPTSQSSGQSAKTIELTAGTSRAHSMSNRTQLKRVENPNSNIVRVEKMNDSTTEVMLVGVSVGRTQVTFTDQNDRVESYELVVHPAANAPVTQVAAPAPVSTPTVSPPMASPPVVHTPPVMHTAPVMVQPDGPVPQVFMKLGEPKPLPSQIIGPEPKAQIFNSNPRIARIDFPPKQGAILVPQMAGVTRITIVGAKAQEIFDVTVLPSISELQKTINKLVPTASVQVVESESGTIIINGTVPTTDDAQMLRTIALQANAIPNIKLGGVQQVQLEVVIAVVNRSKLRNMTFSWQQTGNLWSLTSLIGGATTIASTIGVPSQSLTGTGANTALSIINNAGNGGTLAFLNALRQEGLSKIISEPRVTTISGRPAFIQSGGTVNIVAGGTSSTGLTANFGTIVNFLPIVLGNDKIHLEVDAQVSNPTTAIPIPGAGAAGTNVVSFSTLTRRASAAVRLEDGQTLVIGGLIQNTVDAQIQRVPVLGDLPFLGVAFTNKNYQEVEEEILVLVTPRLVEGVDCTKFPKYLPGRETRSPDDFEFFLEGIMEAPRGPRSVDFHPHRYRPAFHGASNIGQVPCFDNRYGSNGANCIGGNCAPGGLTTGGFQGSYTTTGKTLTPDRGTFTPGVNMVRPLPNQGDMMPVSRMPSSNEFDIQPMPALRDIQPVSSPSNDLPTRMPSSQYPR